ncbi:uncharacterized protein LOC121747513 [Salvia splendens]|uniref:uncharacterized protein LOC121747513 n=1 Tax=Salvia splendens TaxID=180675 RepID=UPI001C254A2F|nr:uncharacterized protein LOC121747513 [Salvia splendens]XP_041997508.1 uncharacterized protein LOC121747513 [Salvia splendens]
MVKVKTKSQSKKSKRGGVDFKKFKRKIGRKLPPPKNTTNTEIKSKAIVLPEQSIASERVGLATSKRGLTLKELLQQTSHHNAKSRKDALHGIKDILLNNPDELKLHKLSVVEKLRERIGDDDEFVRETLYQLFKSVIFPGGTKDNQGPVVSLMMAYVFNAIAHLVLDVRLMAFKFSDLVVQFYPSSFPFYAEKVLQNYENFLRKNQFLEDKSKLKSILAGLVRCLSLLPCEDREHAAAKNDIADPVILHAFEPESAIEPIGLVDFTRQLKDILPILVACFHDFIPLMHSTSQLDQQSCECMQFLLQSIEIIVKVLVGGICESESDTKIIPFCGKPGLTACNKLLPPMILKKLWDAYPLNLVHLTRKDYRRISMLNTTITQIFLQLKNWDQSPSVLLDKFLEFIESSMATKMQLGKIVHEKDLVPLIPYIPKLVMQISGSWRPRILQAFTEVFKNSSPESPMKLACIIAIEEMLALGRSSLNLDESDPSLLSYQISWIQDLPSVLILLDDKSPACTKAVLRLLLYVGQCAPLDSPFSREFDTLQFRFKDFFCKLVENDKCFGPFIRHAGDIKELAICCLYYFSYMDSLLLQSLVSCCLCNVLEPLFISRIFEVLQSSFRAGHILVADYISIHVTLLSRFQVYPDPVAVSDGKSHWKTFKNVTSVVCSSLSQIGDDNLVLQMLEKIIVDQICSDIPLDNKCAFVRLLLALDSKPSRLSDLSVVSMSHVLPQYMTSVLSNVRYNDEDSMSVISVKRRQYYLLPCYYLIYGSKRLLSLVLNVMGSWVSEASSSVDRSNTICSIASVLLLMYEDVKVRQILPSCKTEMASVIQNMLNLLTCGEGPNMTLEERYNIERAYNQLRAITNSE